MSNSRYVSAMESVEELNEFGRVWLRGVLSPEAIAELAALVDVGEKPGTRLSLTEELSRFVGPRSAIAEAVQEYGVDTMPVRLVAFNKNEAANWSVPWHQDRVVAVAQRTNVSAYSNWVQKSEFWHCEPPVSLLTAMIFVRIYIDTDNEKNGSLELALRSHKCGIVPTQEAGVVASGCEIETCKATAGDVLVVHALALHRSSSAAVRLTRRALRVDYAPRRLLDRKLEWAVTA